MAIDPNDLLPFTIVPTSTCYAYDGQLHRVWRGRMKDGTEVVLLVRALTVPNQEYDRLDALGFTYQGGGTFPREEDHGLPKFSDN